MGLSMKTNIAVAAHEQAKAESTQHHQTSVISNCSEVVEGPYAKYHFC